jgi:hypothetical protein
MAINASVEIFVIKTHSVLNLLPFWSRNVGDRAKGIVFAQMAKDIPRFGCKNWRNPQLLAE